MVEINIGSRTFIYVEIFLVDCYNMINDERMSAHDRITQKKKSSNARETTERANEFE